MKIFVNGSTGFIGSRLTNRLAESGYTVHALYRSEKKAEVLRKEGVHLFKGDILDKMSLEKAMQGCEVAFHVAAFAKVWMKDNYQIYRLNILGALNTVEAALKCGVKKIIITSTAGVYGPSDKVPVDESHQNESFYIDYERSKALMEKALKTLSISGVNIVILNPTRVYGPGVLSESNGVTLMIDRYIRGKWRVIPGRGRSMGNYVYVDDVVEGHILAIEKGRSGENYILAGENVDYLTFFEVLSKISGKKYKLFKIPLLLMLPASSLMLIQARIFGTSPLIIPSLVKKFNDNFMLTSAKAEKELGYRPRSFEEGLKETLQWLNHG